MNLKNLFLGAALFVAAMFTTAPAYAQYEGTWGPTPYSGVTSIHVTAAQLTIGGTFYGHVAMLLTDGSGNDVPKNSGTTPWTATIDSTNGLQVTFTSGSFSGDLKLVQFNNVTAGASDFEITVTDNNNIYVGLPCLFNLSGANAFDADPNALTTIGYTNIANNYFSVSPVSDSQTLYFWVELDSGMQFFVMGTSGIPSELTAAFNTSGQHTKIEYYLTGMPTAAAGLVPLATCSLTNTFSGSAGELSASCVDKRPSAW